MFLIKVTVLIHPERTVGAAQAAIQFARADAQAEPVRAVVLPDQIAATGPDAGLRINLFARQRPGDVVFQPFRRVIALRAGKHRQPGRQQAGEL